MRPSEPTRKGNVLSQTAGLLPDEAIRCALRGFAVDIALALRSGLAAGCPELREKLNTASRYLGYGLVGGYDALYAYVSKNGLTLDIKVPLDRADGLLRLGFQVCPRKNFQATSGWLTGLVVPADTDNLSAVLHLALEALRQSDTTSDSS